MPKGVMSRPGAYEFIDRDTVPRDIRVAMTHYLAYRCTRTEKHWTLIGYYYTKHKDQGGMIYHPFGPYLRAIIYDHENEYVRMWWQAPYWQQAEGAHTNERHTQKRRERRARNEDRSNATECA